jgi:hypothetical protein
MSESKFKPLQEDICFKSPEEEEEVLEPDKMKTILSQIGLKWMNHILMKRNANIKLELQ